MMTAKPSPATRRRMPIEVDPQTAYRSSPLHGRPYHEAVERLGTAPLVEAELLVKPHTLGYYQSNDPGASACSSPIFGRLTQRLECHPHTVEVAGSNPAPPIDLRRISVDSFSLCFRNRP